MKTIIPNQPFKHAREAYEKGKEYEVSDEDAHYFQMVGWVGPSQQAGEGQALDIHDGRIGHESEVN